MLGSRSGDVFRDRKLLICIGSTSLGAQLLSPECLRNVARNLLLAINCGADDYMRVMLCGQTRFVAKVQFFRSKLSTIFKVILCGRSISPKQRQLPWAAFSYGNRVRWVRRLFHSNGAKRRFE